MLNVNSIDHDLTFEKPNEFTESILKDIDRLKGTVKTYNKLTQYINNKYETQFELPQIKYQVTKLLQQTFGRPANDAFHFVQIAKDEARNNEGFFKFEVNQSSQLYRIIFLSKTMLNYSNYFLDIVLVDSTYKRNRFNLPLINVVGINNLGQNILLAFGLLANETLEAYEWFFSHLKNAWKNKNPKI